MVKDPRLVPMIEELEQAALSCPADARDEVRKRVHAMIARLEAEGHHVPQRLYELDEMLTDASVEDAFDNLPV
jgi:hypothetical protein